MKKSLPYFSRLVLLFASAVVLVAQTDQTSAFTGTWKLNVEKSKFTPGHAPQSATVTLAPNGKTTVEEVDAQAKPYKWSFPWSDGVAVPIDGIENATFLEKRSDDALDQTMKVGKRTLTARCVLSQDGRTMTRTVNGTDDQGHRWQGVQIYEKQ